MTLTNGFNVQDMLGEGASAPTPAPAPGGRISLEEAATRLDVTKQTVINWIKKGLLSDSEGAGRRGSPMTVLEAEVVALNSWLRHPITVRYMRRQNEDDSAK